MINKEESISFSDSYISDVRYGEIDITSRDNPIPRTLNINDPSLSVSDSAKYTILVLEKWAKDNIVYRFRDSQPKEEWRSIDLGHRAISDLTTENLDLIEKSIMASNPKETIVIFNRLSIDPEAVNKMQIPVSDLEAENETSLSLTI